MNFTTGILGAIVGELHDAADRYPVHSDEWYILQDAADALGDALDLIAELNG